MLSIGQRLEDGASSVNACVGDTVTAPVDFKTLSFQGKEDDQGANSDGAGEARGCDAERGSLSVMRQAIGRSGGHSLVVLGPPGQEMPPDVVVKDEGDGDGGPDVGHVVRSPVKSTD